MTGYAIAFGFGATVMGAVWYFYPTELAAIQNELAAVKAKLRAAETRLLGLVKLPP